jgi:predicted TIM-barrel fold metal-dependent hydrolase
MGTGIGLRYRGKCYGHAQSCTCLSRRDVFVGIAALGAAASGLWPATATSQVASPAVRIIDTHHHIYPPRYKTENIERVVKDIGIAPAAFYLNWSPGGAIEKMDKAGVATAINSMSSPGVWFGDGEAGRARARECNEFGAQLERDFPGRFGMFAAVPLPDVEGSLREIAYALDVLKLDGIGLLTSYADKFLGDPTFSPVMEEMNRRKAVVFVHPTTTCCVGLVPDVSGPYLEFMMDTTRTITSLIVSGAFGRYPDIRFIFSHGGGALLPVVNRIAALAARMKPEERAAKLPKGFEYELRRQHYDLASVGFNPAAMEGLRKLLPNSQFLYGSDEPFSSTVDMAASLNKLGFSSNDLQAIQRDNALRLFPRFQT